VQVKEMLHNVGGVKLDSGPEQNKGKKMFVPGLSENEAKSYLLLHASFITNKLVHD
jgi:hypothetical protein